MNLTDLEAKKLAQAGVEVAKHYKPVALSPKTAAWFVLGQIAVTIYAPKVYALHKRYKASKRKRAQAAGADALNLHIDGADLTDALASASGVQ